MGKINIHTIVYAILISIMILPKKKRKFNIIQYKYIIIQNLNNNKIIIKNKKFILYMNIDKL